MSENLCCVMIIYILTFLLCLLQPGYRPVESSIQEIEDALAQVSILLTFDDPELNNEDSGNH